MLCVFKVNCWLIYILRSNRLFSFLNIFNFVSNLSNLIIHLEHSISSNTSSVSDFLLLVFNLLIYLKYYYMITLYPILYL